MVFLRINELKKKKKSALFRSDKEDFLHREGLSTFVKIHSFCLAPCRESEMIISNELSFNEAMKQGWTDCGNS